MPAAARKSDPTGHGTPLSPGPASPDVNIGYARAWRALPAGVGGGIEKASSAAAGLMNKTQLRPAEIVDALADISGGLTDSAAAAGQEGNAAAAGATATALAGFAAANATLTTAYGTAASSGPEPAAAEAYAKGLQAALAAAAGAAVSAIAAMTDTHTCPTVSGPSPHGPGVVTRGCATVFVNYLPAAREGDKVFEAVGGPDPIAKGCMTVNVGDLAGGGGGGSGGGPGKLAATEPAKGHEAPPQAQAAPQNEADEPQVIEGEIDGCKPAHPKYENYARDDRGAQLAGPLPDGSADELAETGADSVTLVDPGVLYERNADGTETITYPDQTIQQIAGDGTIRTIAPGGRVTTQHPDGRISTESR